MFSRILNHLAPRAALGLASLCLLGATAAADALDFSATNPSGKARKDEPLTLTNPALVALVDQTSGALTIKRAGQPVPFQVISTPNGHAVVLLQDFKPHESAKFEAVKGGGPAPSPKRTQAVLSAKFDGEWFWGFEGGVNKWQVKGGHWTDLTELNVDPRHVDHTFDIRLEGPAWENDVVAYRQYLDWRDGLDTFGKKTSKLVLQDIGRDGFDSYHEMADWGADNLKVGNGLGVGAPAWWDGKQARRVSYYKSQSCKITANGNLYSEVQIKWNDWRTSKSHTNLLSRLGIFGGTRLSRNTLTFDGRLDNIATGIVKLKDHTFISSPAGKKGWNYIASYGPEEQLHIDLGLAIFYRAEELKQHAEDKLNHLLVFKPEGGKASYYVAEAWKGEPNGIQNISEFRAWLAAQAAVLNNPVQVKFE